MFIMRLRTCLALTAAIATLSIVSPVCANMVTNGSFEIDSFRGAGAITGWTGAGNTGLGVDPNIYGYPTEADNGVVPDGSKVAYLMDKGSSLSQVIHGLKAGPTYHLHYRDNSKNAWTAYSQVTVKLDDQTLDWHYFSSVEGAWSYAQPYYTREIDFKVPADGDYTLSFIQTGVVDSSLGLNYHSCSLIDDVVLTESVETALNGSFEADSFCGNGTITNWTATGNTGLCWNPDIYGYPSMNDNGLIPDGKNAAFLFDTGASLSQTIYGLKANSKYHLQYRDNSSSYYTASSQVTVKIGDNTIDWHYFNSVEGAYSYTKPYYTRDIDFWVPADGDYALSFTQTGVVPSGYSGYHPCSLLDNIVITSTPEIMANGSFEADSFNGSGAISSWTATGDTGLCWNPSIYGYPSMNDNGLIPSGKYAAYLSGTGASLSQTIHNMKSDMIYHLHYCENSQNVWCGWTQLAVDISGREISRNNYPSVEGAYTYTKPYYVRDIDFTVPADGDYTIKFTQTGVVPSDYPLYHACALLDNVVLTATPIPDLANVIDYSDDVTVDGDLSDWADADWRAFDKVYDLNPWDLMNADMTPNGSAWAVRWGAGGTKVYVAVKVLDVDPYGDVPTHSFTDSYDNWNTRDAVELYLHTTGSDSGPYGATDYVEFQEPAQQWTVGIKDSDHNSVWTANGYPYYYEEYNATPDQFLAYGKESGNWLYYEAALTPYQYFGGRRGKPSIISLLRENSRINTSAVAVGCADYEYTGMVASDTGGGWSADYHNLPLAQLVRRGVKGTVTLMDYGASTLGAGVTIAIKDAGNVTETHKLVLDGSGNYSFKTNLTGLCMATISAAGYPSQTQPVTVANGSGAVNFTLIKQIPKGVSTTDAKKQAIGTLVNLTEPITAVFNGSIYVESANRISGIRVDKPSHGFTIADAGKVVTITGTVQKDPDTGEIYISASDITSANQMNMILPLGLTNKALGGGSFNNQIGVNGGTGANNIGLLIRTTGIASNIGANGFTLSDGSGVAVSVSAPGISLAYEGKYVTVTGISSIGSDGERVIKAQSTGNVQAVN